MPIQPQPLTPEKKPLPPEELAELGLPLPAKAVETAIEAVVEVPAVAPVTESVPVQPAVIPPVEILIAPAAPVIEAPLPTPTFSAAPVAEVPAMPEAAPSAEVISRPEVVAPVQEVKPKIIAKVETTVPVAAPTAAAVQSQDELIKEIETIMTEDLEEEYMKLPPSLQKKFRKEGEETSKKIKVLLSSAKINLKKLMNLLIRWLRIIPHVDKYFLVQEAKIKADKLAFLKENDGFEEK